MRKISTLDNGLRVVTHYMPAVESVTFGVWNSVGCRDEREVINGAAHFLEHMAFKGTKSRTAFQIAEEIENVGGDINAYTSNEVTAYHVKLIAEDLNVGINILSDILQNSTFLKDECKYKNLILKQPKNLNNMLYHMVTLIQLERSLVPGSMQMDWE